MENRVELEKRYSAARGNLLLVAVLSLVNIVLSLMNAGITFLFSATFPIFMVELGLLFRNDPTLSALGGLCFALGFAAVGVYGLSKKHKAFLLVVFIFFIVDTGFLFWMLSLTFDASVLIDIAFHVWVLWALGRGVWAWTRLMDLPEEPPAAASPAVEPPQIYPPDDGHEPPAAF